MTVKELIEQLKELDAEGKGDVPVVWTGMSLTYDVELTETTRGGKPVILVN